MGQSGKGKEMKWDRRKKYENEFQREGRKRKRKKRRNKNLKERKGKEWKGKEGK